MLQYRSVYPETLELLKQLMELDGLKPMHLVGGTALALHLGHRISVDLDLFTMDIFDTEPILLELRHSFELNIVEQKEQNILNLELKGKDSSYQKVKVDLIRYNYPLLREIQTVDGIRLLHIEDIIPMKMSALANRGSKKDFFDMYEILKHYDLKEMFELFKSKFPDVGYFHIIKSLTYFDDAEDDIDPISLNETNWQNVKATIADKVKNYS